MTSKYVTAGNFEHGQCSPQQGRKNPDGMCTIPGNALQSGSYNSMPFATPVSEGYQMSSQATLGEPESERTVTAAAQTVVNAISPPQGAWALRIPGAI